MNDVIAVSAGTAHTMAIRSDNSLWAWGSNESYSRLGDGTTEARHLPVRIMADVIAVSAGFGGTVAIKTDGSLWAWGEIGFEEIYSSDTPIKIMDDVVAVSTSGSAIMVIKVDGGLWAWGGNNLGQLGDGTTNFSFTPIKILDDVVAVSTGTSRSAAITADGSLWVWGGNVFGGLGDGTTTNRHEPLKIMDDVISVSIGLDHMAAIKTDGSLWIWGRPTVVEGIRPFNQIPTHSMDNVVAVSAGGRVISTFSGEVFYTLALRADASLWTWGANHNGQLGDGDTTSRMRTEPAKIMDNVMLPGRVEPIAPLPPPPPIPYVRAIPNTPTLRFTIGSNNFLHNETVQQLEVAPFISQGRTMIPLRVIAESLGAEVDWDSATRTVIITNHEEIITLTVDVPLPDDMGTPIILNGFTFVPVRYVSEKLGATIHWDGDSNAVYIYKK
jgi:hypothetical protein